MEKRYDLFELPSRGFPQWLDSASNLAEATDKMISLPPPGPGGEYLVRDFYSGKIVAYTLPVRSGTAIFPSSRVQADEGPPGREAPAFA